MSRRLVSGMGLILLLAACSGGTGSATTATAAAETTTATTAATTSSPPTTSAPATTPAPGTTVAPVEPADIIFTGGRVMTMDPAFGTVAAIAITGDRIAAVGSTDEIAGLAGPDTTVIDLEGMVVQPGFIDPHSHLLTDAGGPDAGQNLAISNGITSLTDASTEQGVVPDLVDFSDSGMLRLRASLYLVRGDVCGTDLGTWYEDFAPGEVLGDRLRVGGVKIFADGGVCGALATSQPFLDGYESGGPPYHDLAALIEMIGTADAGGYQVIIHAQGDVAIAEAQDAYAAVLDGRGNVLRHRIEHNAIQSNTTIGRYAELGIIPTVFGPSEACNADLPWTDFYKEHGDRPGDLIAANPGLIVAWHGDDPWMTPISPILEYYSLVTRARVDTDGSICEPAEWMKGAEVDRRLALQMMTINAAYAIGQDDVVGSLTPGKYADLVVLTDDLTAVPADSIPDVQLLATMIGGVTEYCRPGAEAWCPGIAPVSGPTASASLSRAGHGPELVLDGNATGDSFWSSGADAPQWIRIDLPEPSSITEIRFTVFQNPPSDTVHQLELLVGGSWATVETFTGFTTTGDVLTWTPLPPVAGVEAIRVTTLQSLSWPEWYEIEVDTG